MKSQHIKLSVIIFFLLIFRIVNAQTDFAFTCTPFLQNMQDGEVTVFWEVNRNATSWVEMGQTSQLGTNVISSKAGMIDIGSGIQKIKLKNLQPGQKYFYRVCSKEVTSLTGYSASFGNTIKSNIYSFNAKPQSPNSFAFLVFNDLHVNTENSGFVSSVVNKNKDINFVVFNGDIVNDYNNESDFCKLIFSPFSKGFGTEKPSYMLRGNHETRGAAARSYYKYVATPTGNFYYTFKWGNVFFVALDCGEDKPDNLYSSYFDLADYDNYRTEQAEWLKEVVQSNEYKNAKVRIVFNHMPMVNETINTGSYEDHGLNDNSSKFLSVLNNTGVNLVLSGHTHQYKVYPKVNSSLSCAQIVGGAPFNASKLQSTTYTKVQITDTLITAKLFNLLSDSPIETIAWDLKNSTDINNISGLDKQLSIRGNNDSIEINSKTSAKIRIFNTDGKLVVENQVYAGITKLPMSKGTYLVQIESNNKASTIKIVL